jgi:hypothetical protein
MNRITGLFFLILLTSPIARSIDKTEMLTPEQFQNYKLDCNGVTFETFTIAEKRALLTDSLAKIAVTFSAKNTLAEERHFSVMLVGSSEDGILWSMNMNPLMSTLNANATYLVSETTYISPGTLKKTTKLWMRVIGDM